MSDPVSQLRGAVTETAAGLAGNGKVAAPKLDRPPRADFGDYSTNAAMLLAPTLGEPPRAIAERLGDALGERLGGSVEKVEIAGPGFLNLFMADAWYLDSLAGMREAGESFGAGGASPADRINVEFVSANPTGPLHIGHTRNAAYGDALARILEFHGHEVTREFYVNDYGSQILRFAESLRARARGEEVPEGGYQGDYVAELAAEIPGAADMDLEQLGRAGVEHMIDHMRESLRRFRVEFDVWTFEHTLHPEAVERAFARLAELGQTFRSESQDNPVYYVQYAHARIASILRKAGEERVAAALDADLRASGERFHPSARSLVKRLLEFPAEVEEAATRRAPHRMTTYAHESAQEFSAFYRDCRVVGAAEEGGDEDVRIAICVLTRDVLARTLDLLGLEAPQSM